MNKQQVIEQLKDLRESQKSFIDDKEADCIFKKDAEALDIAIKVLEGTAQEVPVQEQWLGKCQYCGKGNKIDLPSNKGIVPKFCMNCSEEITYVKEVSIQEKIESLEKLCKPIARHLKEYYDPHCTVVITDDYIKLVEDTIGIPVRSDD